MLLTKASGGGGGGPSDSYGAPPSSSYGPPSGGGPSDSYGAPPPSSYGPPSGGGGGYSGGGWGRSFHKPMTSAYDNVIKAEAADGSNNIPMIGEATSNTESIDYPDYQDYQEMPISDMSFANSNWNRTDYAIEHERANLSFESVKNDSKVDSKIDSSVNKMSRSFDFKNPLTNIVKVIEKKNADLTTSTDQPDVTYNTNMTYMNEWQATDEKVHSDNVLSPSDSNAKTESQQVEPRSIPLIRGI